MKVLIIEDEQLASRKLSRLINEIDSDIEIIDVLESVEDTGNWLMEHSHPDLIFMDIQLNDGVCFEIFDTLEINSAIIFTTAFDEYALNAFKVNSIDYLLKPISVSELKNAIEKFKKFQFKQVNKKIETVLEQLKPGFKERFLIKIGDRYKSIETRTISCFYIRERCNFIITENGKSYPIDYSLEKLEKMLDSSVFFRINRNMIVNINSIDDMIAYSSSRLKLKISGYTDAAGALVSRERVGDFKSWMDS